MKKIANSVWIPAVLFIYATALFAYLFFYKEVGFSARNLTLAVLSYVIIILVYVVNRRNEKKKASKESIYKQK